MAIVNNADTQYMESYATTTQAKVDVQTFPLIGLLLNCPLSSPSLTLQIPLTVKALVQKNCTISATNLVFPAQGLLTAGAWQQPDQRAMHQQQRVFAGAQWRDGGRQRAGAQDEHSTAADTVGYQLYQGSNYAIVWGDATGGSPMAGLGTGAAQSYTVYGLVPQATPRPGSYSDTVTATITF